MARISKSGITNGGTIDASHITRIIEALDGTGSADIVATGSFTGSFVGNGSGITGIVSSTATSASYAATASFLTGTISSASFASTASYVNSLAQNVTITGSLTLSGSASTVLTVQKRAVFNDTTTFNSDAIISGMLHYDLVTQTTTDATQTDVWSYAMANGRVDTIEVTVIGGSGSLLSTDAVGGNLVGVVRCESGNAFIVGQTSSSFDSSGFSYTYAAYGLRREVATNNIHFWVRGLASTEIDWQVAVRQL
jgi:hypothetical protein